MLHKSLLETVGAVLGQKKDDGSSNSISNALRVRHNLCHISKVIPRDLHFASVAFRSVPFRLVRCCAVSLMNARSFGYKNSIKV